MGALLSYFWAPGQVVEGAEHLSPVLTKKEIVAVQKTWSLLKLDSADSGKILFIELFKKHPGHQKLFKPFADVPLEELYNHKKFHAHAVTVMYALSSFVDHLADVDCMTELIHRTARNHFFRAVQPEDFGAFTCLIVPTIENKIGGVLDHLTYGGWQKVIKLVDDMFIEGMKFAAEEENAEF